MMDSYAQVSPWLIKAQDLVVGPISGKNHALFAPLSFTLAPATITLLVGANGIGKSTLLHTVTHKIRPFSGTLVFKVRPWEIAYLPQRHGIERDFPMSVNDFAAMGLWRQRGLFKNVSVENLKRVEQVFASLGIAEWRHQGIGSLSDGQFQKARFARLMLQDAPIMLLDEPYTALDAASRKIIQQVMVAWKKAGKGLILAVHAAERYLIPHDSLIDLDQHAFLDAPTQLAAQLG